MTLSPTQSSNSEKGIRVVTGARLHFGLIDTVAPFGGVGVMIDQPATEVELQPADQFGVDGPAAPRVSEIADRLIQFLSLPQRPACQIRIAKRPPAHTGLGTGTQLAMAVADSLARFAGANVSDFDLAHTIADRGKRSAVGVHGYLHGGLIFESSDKSGSDLNAIQQRVELPSQWTVVVTRRTAPTKTIHGNDEQQQFSQLSGADPVQRERLTQIVGQEMIPSAQSGDFDGFADAVHRYNHQSGMLFSQVQGGPYNGQAVSQLVESLIRNGAKGVGQSSWGPSVFSWFRTKLEAQEFVSQWPQNNEETEFAICQPLNRDARRYDA